MQSHANLCKRHTLKSELSFLKYAGVRSAISSGLPATLSHTERVAQCPVKHKSIFAVSACAVEPHVAFALRTFVFFTQTLQASFICMKDVSFY